MIPLNYFYYPIVSIKCKKNSAKTINKTYLENIKRSERFMVEVRDYINYNFIKDYGREIDSKFMDLANRWETDHKKTDSVNLLINSIKEYFKDSKSKLPWTIYEIQFAMGKIRKILS